MTQHTLLSDTDTIIAVVGATDSPGKYGGVAYRFLKGRGYRVFAINPGQGTVDGDPAYPDLGSLPDRPDIINLVVPARVGSRVVDEAAELGYRSVWFQPGADDPQVVDKARELGMDVVAGDCIMVAARLAAHRS
jgi:predicted CoA-binding protein